MNLLTQQQLPADGRIRRTSGYTLMEMLVAVGISAVVLTMMATFITMALRSTSGIVRQSVLNGQAGRTSEFIFDRVRFATSITNDVSGNTLTLGFDDNITADSNGDGKAYNDKDHYEIFQFLNGDGNDATTANNRLIYKARSDVAATNVLIASAIGKLPAKSVFVVTNGIAVLVNYLLVDDYGADGYQSCAVEAVFMARNRPDASSLISILP